MKLYSYSELTQAHDHSFGNLGALQQSKLCGCFCCVTIFSPKKMDIFSHEEKSSYGWISAKNFATAICPNCGVDSVIGDESGFPITEAFLIAMREQWFGTDDSSLPPPDGNLEPLAQSFRELFEAALEQHS